MLPGDHYQPFYSHLENWLSHTILNISLNWIILPIEDWLGQTSGKLSRWRLCRSLSRAATARQSESFRRSLNWSKFGIWTLIVLAPNLNGISLRLAFPPSEYKSSRVGEGLKFTPTFFTWIPIVSYVFHIPPAITFKECVTIVCNSRLVCIERRFLDSNSLVCEGHQEVFTGQSKLAISP